MNLHINPEWLLEMAEKEANGIISVGGIFYRNNKVGRQMKLRIELTFYQEPPIHLMLAGERTVILNDSTDPADQEQSAIRAAEQLIHEAFRQLEERK